MFVTGRNKQPSLIFAGKSGNYQSGGGVGTVAGNKLGYLCIYLQRKTL